MMEPADHELAAETRAEAQSEARRMCKPQSYDATACLPAPEQTFSAAVAGPRGVIMSEQRQLFPMMLDLTGRRCVVVGAGAIGEGKIQGLLATKAKLAVLAPTATPAVLQWARQGLIDYRHGRFEPNDLNGAFLVVAATSSAEVNHQICDEARRHGVLCNVVDDPEYCDFFYPAVVRRGALQIAISTSGVSPAFARRVREKLEVQFGEEYGAWLDQVAHRREEVLRNVTDPAQRRRILEELATADSPLRADAER
jgi:precorrin-2 dehydrogenase/sirohydrochlorin ferrochelatase